MGDPHRRSVPLDAAFDEAQTRNVREAELIQSLGLAARDVARRWAARWIRIFVVLDERLPVLVTGALHGFSDLLTCEGHDAPYNARCLPELASEREGAAGPVRHV
jgi:hypothetical protein